MAFQVRSSSLTCFQCSTTLFSLHGTAYLLFFSRKMSISTTLSGTLRSTNQANCGYSSTILCFGGGSFWVSGTVPCASSSQSWIVCIRGSRMEREVNTGSPRPSASRSSCTWWSTSCGWSQDTSTLFPSSWAPFVSLSIGASYSSGRSPPSQMYFNHSSWV